MDLYGFFWIYAKADGFMWIYTDLWEGKRIYADLYAFIWRAMDLLD